MMNERTAKTAMIVTVLAALGSLAAVRGASALEISLEENRADRGNIGYVDIRRIFNAFPETRRAKQSYREVVRQAEEQINLRKTELLTLRQEILDLKMERELLKRTPILPASGTPPGGTSPAQPSRTSPEVSRSTESAAEGVLEPGEEKELKDAAADDDSLDMLPGMSRPLEENPPKPEEASPEPKEAEAAQQPEPESETPPAEPLIINIPGVTEEPILVEPPSTTPPTEPPPGAAAAADEKAGGESGPGGPTTTAETPAAVTPLPESAAESPPLEEPLPAAETTAAEPRAEEPVPPPVQETLDTLARDRHLDELEENIRMKEAEYRKKSEEFKEYQARVEKDLIAIEDRRSDILLGRIYNAIREVARTAGVSVVVDKNHILFGQPSVDLTDKVIKKLEEQSL